MMAVDNKKENERERDEEWQGQRERTLHGQDKAKCGKKHVRNYKIP